VAVTKQIELILRISYYWPDRGIWPVSPPLICSPIVRTRHNHIHHFVLSMVRTVERKNGKHK
jgi:hypothetical protein